MSSNVNKIEGMMTQNHKCLCDKGWEERFKREPENSNLELELGVGAAHKKSIDALGCGGIIGRMIRRNWTPKKAARAAKSAAPKKRAGRKSAQKKPPAEKYDPQFNNVAHRVYALGGGPADVAGACGVAVASVYNWLASKPEFRAACEDGGRRFEDKAEVTYKQGLMIEATPHDEKATRDTKDGPMVCIKHGVFDLKNVADYLKRRKPEKYSDKTQANVNFDWRNLAKMATGAVVETTHTKQKGGDYDN